MTGALFPFALFASDGTDPVTLPLSMLIVFGSAKLLAALFERVGQPGIVGQILAGVIVGPPLLGWIQPNQLLHALADLGVIFLLFRVGLKYGLPSSSKWVGPRSL